MTKHAFRRAAATTGLVAGLMGVTAVEAVGSQGGYSPGPGLYDYYADSGERNQITVRQTGGRFDFTDAGVRLIRPAYPTSDPFTCTMRLNNVSCPEVQEMSLNLGDRDDSVDVQGVNSLGVTGGPGRDVVRTDRNVQFFPGAGPDDLIAPPGWGSVWEYGEQSGSMRITVDGVANDGPPGENDNIRPGIRVRVGSGDHVLIGDGGPNDFEVGGTGHSDFDGGAGNDYFSSSQSGGATMRGGTGDDHLSGSAASDVIEGGDGNDNLQAYYGVDQVDAGPGDDIVESYDDAADTVDCGDGNDKVIVDALDTTTNCETVQVGY